jgi:MFS family permease
MSEVSTMAVPAPAAPSTTSPLAGAEPWPKASQAWYALTLFAFTVFTLFAALPITGLVITQIKADFQLSDKQVALLVSSLPMWVYAFASLPISRLADSFSRKLIIGLGLLALGLFGAGAALATTVTTFFIMRMVGGIGGAGNGAATFSILGDLFPPEKLPKALAIMNFGFCAALGLPLIIGAQIFGALSSIQTLSLPLVGEVRPWQSLLLIIAIPDLILGLLIIFTLREPKRRARSMPVDSAGAGARKSVPVKDILAYMWTNRRAFWPMYVGLGLNCFAFGTAAWSTPFFERTFGWTPAQFGTIQGLVYLLAAPACLLFGGWLAERWTKQGRADAALRVVVLGSGLHIPFAMSFGLVPNPYVALALLSLSTCLALIGAGPQNAAFQTIVPNEMRAQITASFLFVFTATQAAGPFVVGWLTDDVFANEKSLRYSLALIHTVAAPLAVLVFWIGLKPYGEAVMRIRSMGR